MCRQLLSSELGGQLAGEEGGLLISHGPQVWVGISDLAALGDYEEMVDACRQYASDVQGRLAGMLLLYEPAEGRSAAVTEMDEIMYLLDLPRREDGVPDNVQMMFPSGKHTAAGGLELRQADWQDTAVLELMAAGADAQEALAGPALLSLDGWPQMLECSVLERDGKVLAVAGSMSGDLAVRLCYIVVDPEMRRQGLGKTLIGKLGVSTQEQSKMFMNCWTQRSGRLRYFTSKAGFEDRLSVRWYISAV